MKHPPHLGRSAAAVVVAAAAIVLAAVLLRSGSGQPARALAQAPAPGSQALQSEASADLSPSQLKAIQVEVVSTYRFLVEKEAVGSIGFVDDLSVQVFPPYKGKIIKTFVELGDEVQKGQPLYTIDSPDLIQAESSLIGAAASFALTSKELARVKDLNGTNGVSERELEQAASDHQTAEGALKAARDAVRVFGKTDSEIDRIVATRKIDAALVVPSPMSGQVTAYNAPPGLLVQPGAGPAPFAIADTSTKWMLANVTESDSPLLHIGRPGHLPGLGAAEPQYQGRSRQGRALRPQFG